MGKKRKQAEEPEGKDTFMMMFVTLSLILLAFFILLNSYAVINAERTKEAWGSLLGSFGLMSGGDSSDKEGGSASQSSSFMSGQSMLKLFEKSKYEFETLVEKMGADTAGVQVDMEFEDNDGEIRIVLAEKMMFPAGASVISPRLFPLLDKIAQLTLESGGYCVVTGHTDDRPMRGGSNWELSIERGTIIARHIGASGRLPIGKIRSSGAAHYQPRADNSTLEGRSENRRVEIIVKTEVEGEQI